MQLFLCRGATRFYLDELFSNGWRISLLLIANLEEYEIRAKSVIIFRPMKLWLRTLEESNEDLKFAVYKKGLITEENVKVIYANCIQQVENSIKHQREYMNVLSFWNFWVRVLNFIFNSACF